MHEGVQGSPWAHVSLLLRTDMENWWRWSTWADQSWLVIYKAPQHWAVTADHLEPRRNGEGLLTRECSGARTKGTASN